MSKLIIPVEYPKEPPEKEPKRISVYYITTTYDDEAEKFIRAINKGGGRYIGCLVVDYYNYWGEINGKQYLHLHHAEEEIGIERWC